MERRHKVTFTEDGKVCPTDPRILKRNPLCANYMMQEKLPFKPDNRPHLLIHRLGHLPDEPDKHKPDLSPDDPRLRQIQKRPYEHVTLPQDDTNRASGKIDSEHGAK